MSPNLDRLAREGMILEQSYVQPLCTPSRASFLSGRYPIHTGRQSSVIWAEEPKGLKADLELLPHVLRDQGYSTHLVGKWHLGFCKKEYLPTHRGFDTFYGYYTGAEDYYNHTKMPNTEPVVAGYDFRDQDAVTWDLENGTYSTQLFADRAIQVIQAEAAANNPMFLYLAFQSVHSPLQVPAKYEEPFSHINNSARRTFSGMVLAMDDAVGRVVTALEQEGLMDNTLIVFSADNGGQTKSGGNNFPLRGNKATLWEGGTRASAFVHGSMLARPGTVSTELIHITDWFPTFVRAAGGEPQELEGLDGLDQWDTLTKDSPSPRIEMVYNIDPGCSFGNGPGGAIRVGSFKLIRGDPGTPDGWIPPDSVEDDESGNDGGCSGPNPQQLLLFDLDNDPTEKENLALARPNITTYLEQVLDNYRAGMVPPDVANKTQKGNPNNFNGIWSSGWCQV